MSSTTPPDGDEDARREEFREMLRETFAPWTKSRQFNYDHPDGDDPSQKPGPDPRSDGESIYRQFGLEPLPKYLRRAAARDHSVAMFPKALAHAVTHIREWEKWELGSGNANFEDLPRLRRELFEWYLADDVADPTEREQAAERRTKQLRDGGTGVILHGEQGTTKTTGMYWLAANIMQVNPDENVIWQSTLDDSEWQVFGPWATLCLPEGVSVDMTANPYSREYRDLGPFPISPTDVCRDVLRYEDPEDLLRQMSERQPGHVYVVYPDPEFRQCQALTGWSYENMWDVDDSAEATDIKHFWFALMEALHSVPEYNYWTTIISDEAHKWLQEGASDDNHDWHKKIRDWATYWGDARKERLSTVLAVHKWTEIHYKVRQKIRWAATMNGERFPKEAPLDGKNADQSLGEMCVWSSQGQWNKVGYPDIKREFSVPANIDVVYPGFERRKSAIS